MARQKKLMKKQREKEFQKRLRHQAIKSIKLKTEMMATERKQEESMQLGRRLVSVRMLENIRLAQVQAAQCVEQDELQESGQLLSKEETEFTSELEADHHYRLLQSINKRQIEELKEQYSFLVVPESSKPIKERKNKEENRLSLFKKTATAKKREIIEAMKDSDSDHAPLDEDDGVEEEEEEEENEFDEYHNIDDADDLMMKIESAIEDRIENEIELMELLNNDDADAMEEEPQDDVYEDGNAMKKTVLHENNPPDESFVNPLRLMTISREDSSPVEEKTVSFKLSSIDEEEEKDSSLPLEAIVQQSSVSPSTIQFDLVENSHQEVPITERLDASSSLITLTMETVQPLPEVAPISSSSHVEDQPFSILPPPPPSEPSELLSIDPFAAPSTIGQFTSPPRSSGPKSRLNEKWENVLDQSKYLERNRVQLKKQETISQFRVAKDGTVKERAEIFVKKFSTSQDGPSNVLPISTNSSNPSDHSEISESSDPLANNVEKTTSPARGKSWKSRISNQLPFLTPDVVTISSPLKSEDELSTSPVVSASLSISADPVASILPTLSVPSLEAPPQENQTNDLLSNEKIDRDESKEDFTFK
jgi:hypothetical protein